MKLQFLGQTYEPVEQHITTLPSEQQATFRGRSYTLPRPITVSKSQLCLRKYRGVSYMLQLSGVNNYES